MILSIIAVLLTFGLVIFLHEFGHFLVCKKLGVRVERFAFGFGPELVGMTHGDTRFSICAMAVGLATTISACSCSNTSGCMSFLSIRGSLLVVIEC